MRVVITRDELNREMERCKASVINRIVTEHGITDMIGFWEKRYDGHYPREILQQQAMDTLAVLKVQERLLQERELWPYKHYSELLSDLDETNKERARIVSEGGVIYGPINYNELIFFDYRFGNAIIQLKKELAEEGELIIEEKDLLDHFNKLKGSIYKSGELYEDYTRQVRDDYVERIYASYIAELGKGVEVVFHEEM
ncbi:hypothetical protein [Proteiniphilum sp. UBA5384]|uniref:hypothetical protein n=1 Tax=Proteiniphilum sp. UBA5384 TaxID=1947279 RepID=UPI0025EF8F0A|nr:hypothetical protein [Proteiniphilum sp. UBA5384]